MLSEKLHFTSAITLLTVQVLLLLPISKIVCFLRARDFAPAVPRIETYTYSECHSSSIQPNIYHRGKMLNYSIFNSSDLKNPFWKVIKEQLQKVNH